ncbi:GlxA family transcriptional regulator [Chitinophaga solisilvae]|uniref:Helix-turn-helix domain-containing protein n=1 Tax=Chitinophaga solisilvae TaxID=1233460 RepID=A0A3S1DQY1_9BACT|nr:helix-turn-helix domain-containing protein [Chitinophaga solisilvae]NSL87724.1 helix-turn-helix domain-containing protein [Chitinophaga solisilvae]
MKHISILVPKGNVALGCIEGSFTVFNKVNDFLADKDREPLFKVQLVGLSADTEVYHRFFSVTPDLGIHAVTKTDLIIIPAVNGEMEKVIENNKDFLPWIAARYQDGAEVASLCVGAFILASTGLLNGKKCATHWEAANNFRRMFPDVNLVSEKIITDENGIYSSGGATSFFNLILYLVEKYAGREIAVICAKVFEIEIDRVNQSPFIIFDGQKGHDDEPIKKAQEYIENNFMEKITVDQLASMLSLSRRNLERRFKKATSNTAVEYMQRVKIEAAKSSLESSRENVSEVMYKVGYTDTKAFRTTFKRITGLSPMEYRNKYNRQAAMAG